MGRPPLGKKPLDASLVIRMTGQLKKRLEELAEDDRRTVGDYIRVVLEDHVEGKRRGK